MEMTPRDRHWYDLICQCRNSGMTDKQWCMEHDIHVSTFYRHVRILKNLSCEIPAVDRNGQRQAGKQDVVPLQIIQEPAAVKTDTGFDGIMSPKSIRAAGNDVVQIDMEEPGISFAPALQVRFPDGISLGISNFADSSILDHVIRLLSET